RVSFEGRAQGPVDLVTAELHVPGGTRIRALGEDLEIGPIDIALGGQTVEIKRLHLGRREGGALDLAGSFSLARRELALDVTLDRLPLTAIAALATGGGGDRPGPLA